MLEATTGVPREKASIADTVSGQAFSETYRFTRVWMQRQQRWQIIAGHVSQLIPPLSNSLMLRI